jgi:transcriptional regulator with XRE-family HTH domain
MTMKTSSPTNFFRKARHSLPKVGKRHPSRSVIARLLGVTEKTIYQWENNRCVPSRRLLPAVASVLNVSIEELGRAVAVASTTADTRVRAASAQPRKRT